MKKVPAKAARESKADMKAELTAMKRGGASKRLLEAERAEHRGMGMKAGGKVAAVGRLKGKY